MADHEASCSCGQLRLTCQGDPVRISICHCLECQRRTGSTFGVQAWYPRQQVLSVQGISKRFTRSSDSGRTVTFDFCSECGGTIFWQAEQRPDLIAVAVGSFADPTFEKPGHSVWERRQHPWTLAIGEQHFERSD
jgi:hypothetical protein